MNNDSSLSGVTDYLDYYNLEEDPFEGEAPLFDGGERRDQFEQLLHLCQFSTSLLAVVGQPGVGKSMFKRELVARLDTLDIVAELDVPLLNNPEQLLTAFAEAFGVPVSTHEGSGSTEKTVRLIDALRDYGATPEEGDPLKIVVVEDAHNLDESSLSCLAQLARSSHEGNRALHLVMFGEPSLLPRLQALETDNLIVQAFTLEPFSRQELKNYLRFRLDAVGFKGVFPFRQQDLQYLWEQSGGVPAAVHGPARELLIDMAAPPPKPKSIGLPLPHMVVVIGLLAGLLLVVFYQVADESSTVASEPVQLSANNTVTPTTPSDEALEETPKTVIEESQSPRTDPTGAPPTERLETASTEEADAPSDNREPTTSSAPPADQPAQESANGNSAESDATKTAAESPSQLVPTTSTASDNKVTGNENAIASEANLEEELLSQARRAQVTEHEARLLELPADQYVLQVLASGSREGVEAFIERQPNKEKLHFYAAKRNGGTFFIAVAGVYNSREAAEAAVAGLPEEQRQTQPWPRRLEAVQGEIRTFRGL